MPKTNEQTKTFDINEFTQLIISTNFGNNKTWDSIRSFNALVYAPDQYVGPENDTQCKYMMNNWSRSPETTRLIDIMYQIYSNPQSAMAQEFQRYWVFINPLFLVSPQKIDIMNIINKIDIFDEKTQLMVLKLISDTKELTSPEVITAKWTKIANHPQATAFDKATAAIKLRNDDIVRDAIEALKKELNDELNQRFPRTDVIVSICDKAKKTIQIYRENHSHNGSIAGTSAEWQYIQSVYDTFNAERALSTGVEYIPKITRSLEERVAAAEQRALAAENKLQISETKAKQEIETERQKSAKFAREMDRMQQLLDTYEAFIKNLKMKVASLKIGLFGKGTVSPEQLQEWVKTNTPQETR